MFWHKWWIDVYLTGGQTVRLNFGRFGKALYLRQEAILFINEQMTARKQKTETSFLTIGAARKSVVLDGSEIIGYYVNGAGGFGVWLANRAGERLLTQRAELKRRESRHTNSRR